MGHTHRRQGEGLTHHVMARGNNRQPIFDDDRDRRSFLGLVDRVRDNSSWRIHAWCLMTNHVHILLTTDRPTLSAGLRDILGLYTRRYNHFHERSGHLFGARFRSVLVESDEQFFATVRYVNRNPVRAGLVERPDHHPWSGYALRSVPRPPVILDEQTVLERLHPVSSIAVRRLHALVCGCVPPGRAGTSRPSVQSLVQALGSSRGADAAVRLGHSRREVAATLGLSVDGLRRLRERLMT